MKAITVRFLGGFSVHYHDRYLDSFEYEKLRALLAYLLFEPPVSHSREAVAELFWPDESPEAAKHSLRQALLKLRGLLNEERLKSGLILTSRITVQRNPDVSLQSDIQDFEKNLEQTLLVDREDTEKLQRAAALYGGEFLQGLSSLNAVEFEEWLLTKREKYRRLAATVYDRLIACHEKTGDYDAACRYAERLLSLEPWREEVHRHLMLLLARTGQRTAALKQYEQCSRVLHRSLGVSPEPETERVYARIRDTAPQQFNLPADHRPFIGRERELAVLLPLLCDRSNRIVTITGLGGMGKTRLAMEAANKVASEKARSFLHGVYFVPLVGIFTHEHLQSAIANSLGLQLSREENPTAQLLRFLQEKELLLILDNFENLIHETNLHFLLKITASSPSVQLLITSRQKLNLRSEQILPIVGLPVLQSHRTDGLRRDEVENCGSVRLFISAMKRIQPDSRPEMQEIASIVRICELVEGMPLAIELASAWTDTLPLSDIVSRIEAGLDVLQRDSPDLPRRHRSIRAVFEGSWLRLTPHEREVMAGVSIFPAGFTGEAFETVTGESFRVLARLVGLSLIQHHLQTERYHLHELLRQFCKGKLSYANASRAKNRHCRYFSSFTRALERNLISTGEESVLRKMDQEYENVNSAWQWAVESKRVTRLDEMAPVLHYFYSRRARYAEGIRAFSTALRAIRNLGPANSFILARLTSFQADLYRETGKTQLARRGLQQSLRLVQKSRHKNIQSDKAFLFWKIGLLTSEAEQARNWLGQSLEIYRMIGDKTRAAAVLVSLGLWWKSAGDLERCKSCLEDSLVLLRDFNSPTLVAEASYHLAGLFLRQGQYESSESLILEGIELSRKSGHLGKVAQGLLLLSQCYFCSGKFKLMEPLLRECVLLQKGLGQQSNTALTTAFLALGLLHLGKYPQAERLCHQALTVATEARFGPAAGVALGVLTCLELAKGSYSNASDLVNRAMEAYQCGWQEDWRARHAILQAFAAHAHCLLGEMKRARAELSEAFHTAFEVRSLIALMSCLPVAAVLFSKDGDVRKAVETYALAKTQPYIANSCWFSDIANSHIARIDTRTASERSIGGNVKPPATDFWEKSQPVAGLIFCSQSSPGSEE